MNYYNKISGSYNELYGNEQEKKLDIIKNNVNISKKSLVLDVGCGTGISSRFFDCIVVGIDSSIEMLKKAKGDFYLNATAEKIPFKDNSFDLVIAVTSVHNFDGIKKGILEIKRVAKKDIVITILRKSKKFLEIKKYIKEIFNIEKIIMENKDEIFFVKG